jgi:hypothetical protein
LSYKTIAGFIWVNSYCPESNLVVKIDDDVSADWTALVIFFKLQ